MRRSGFRLGLAALVLPALAPVPASALSGVMPPERIGRSYEVVCQGRRAALTLDEAFDPEQVPAGSVSLRSFTPLGSGEARPTPVEAAEVFAAMTLVRDVTWLCFSDRVVVMVTYVDRERFRRFLEEEISREEGEAESSVAFTLDASGLTVQRDQTAARADGHQ